MIHSRSTLAAALVAVAMAFGCTTQPEPPEAQRIDAVQPLPFHTAAMAARPEAKA